MAAGPAIIAMGMLGAALLFGDGAITPAISVLSALEGLKGAGAAIAPYVVPLSIVVLIALFSIQPQGTGRISQTFRPGHDDLVRRHRRPRPSSRSCAIRRCLGRSIRSSGCIICSATG